MELLKFGLSCSIGGIFGCILSVIFYPKILWLATISGFAGGYLIYEFREVLINSKLTIKNVFNSQDWNFKNDLREILEFASKPRPLTYISGLTLFLLNIIFWSKIVFVYSKIYKEMIEKHGEYSSLIPSYFLLFILFLFLWMSVAMVYHEIAKYGAKKFGLEDDFSMHVDGTKPIDYSTFFRLFFYGLIYLIIDPVVFIFWKLPVNIVKVISYILVFLLMTILAIFIAVYSNKRMLRGLSGAVGATVSVFYFSDHNPIVMILCGGLIGGAFGVLNFQLISKRLFELENQN